MNFSNKKSIFISLVLSIITTFLIYNYIKNIEIVEEPKELTNVFIAKDNLPPKHKIKNTDIMVTQIPSEIVSERAVTNTSDIIGKYVKDRIIKGEQILKDRLIQDENKELVYNIPYGKRAVSVNVNEQIQVARMIRPGDRVDIIVSFLGEQVEDTSSKIIYRDYTKTILQDILVLALGDKQSDVDNKWEDEIKTATLAVTLEEAEKLIFATENGVIRMALRMVDDVTKEDTQGITREDLTLDKAKIIIPN